MLLDFLAISVSEIGAISEVYYYYLLLEKNLKNYESLINKTSGIL